MGEKMVDIVHFDAPACPCCGKAMVRVLIQIPGEELGHWHPAWMCDCRVSPESVAEDTTTPLQGFQRISEREWRPGSERS
jgi:hypothetical protein